MTQDPISEILRLADVESVVSGGFIAGGDWAVRFPAPYKLKFFAAVRGSCWLRVDGEAGVSRIEPGDVLLLTAPRVFTMASDLAVEPVDAHTLFEGRTSPIVRMVEESRGGQPGSGLATTQLAHLLFVHILRAHLAVNGPLKAGWLRVAADPRLAPALRLMHGAPGTPWRLAQHALRRGDVPVAVLAQDLGYASESAFSHAFKRIVGVSPSRYAIR